MSDQDENNPANCSCSKALGFFSMCKQKPEEPELQRGQAQKSSKNMHRMTKSNTHHQRVYKYESTGMPGYQNIQHPVMSGRREQRHSELMMPNVNTVNIVINQYANNRPIEEEKISKIIHNSIKSIAKIIESSSNDRKNPHLIKKDLSMRPPRLKVRKIKKVKKKSTRKEKNFSVDGREEKKECNKDLDLNVELKENVADALNTIEENYKLKLNMSQPNIDIKGIIRKTDMKKDMRAASFKPEIKRLSDSLILKRIRIQNVREKLKEAVRG
ncbi:unnamed protein product [Moneuplotes crassus]|uniref:Uncharacterized protein n=1 Tax=Euplotes crassus TaxID=5936 RepID=A0AAD1UKY8_EUPCR|nr:unnamed protein product [Moneuplotes crassus]